MKGLVQKSVRLPAYIVNFVEKQPGDNFSQKLVLFLEEIFSDEEILRKLKSQREELARNERKLAEQSEQIYAASNVLRRLAGILSCAEGVMEGGGSDSALGA